MFGKIKVYKARKALIPFQHSMEGARIHERVALGETLLTCVAGGIFNVQRAQRCSQATWEAPQRKGRRAFEEKLEWVRQVCPVEP